MANPPGRYVSALTKDTMALVLAGGRGSRLEELTEWRAKPSVYFGGKFRIIDFPLSNCVNSGIRQIGVLTQYKAHSLIRHLVNGWSHFKREFGETVEIMPASQRYSENWYLGTADAIYQNIDIIRGMRPKYILILSGDHIYKMDYGPMIAQHVESEAKMTVSCIETTVEEAAGAFGVMKVNEDYRVVDFQEKPAEPAEIPGKPGFTLASMGNYVFDANFLLDLVEADAKNPDSTHDFGNDIIPSIIAAEKVFAYGFRAPSKDEKAYWRDVGTLDSFWEANMEMIATTPALNLYDQDWPIWTYQAQLPSAKFVFNDEDKKGMALESVVSAGCIISGAVVTRSLLFSNVKVEVHSEVEDSVILPSVTIEANCKIKKAIIDRGCIIPEGSVIGYDHDADRAAGYRVTNKGVVLITRSMQGLPHGYSFED
ncbi:glucose-1-phosphate adenylyltransferase [Psychrosphaera sp. 1_MG-2023]|uniref:glucose-1-phosphate adenylyltransferase n=1 Tax=Psychrosphaera sp. 1_MG-2023 TaxID=3062643 RepID=UPI0026E1A977|nr:glucose-1-phosphate adenylyltransferase [Psychrosphaera sp. 1_MG-2023]MDO6720445.1 glucose-1-phosphate adenylyltransferase [Psychrosphaera sp. 1_MG-2023]